MFQSLTASPWSAGSACEAGSRRGAAGGAFWRTGRALRLLGHRDRVPGPGVASGSEAGSTGAARGGRRRGVGSAAAARAEAWVRPGVPPAAAQSAGGLRLPRLRRRPRPRLLRRLPPGARMGLGSVRVRLGSITWVSSVPLAKARMAFPSWISSPSRRRRGSSTRCVFTNVPLEEPRSSITALTPSGVIRAWLREMPVSPSVRSASSPRPIVIAPASGISRPASSPSRMTSIDWATAASLFPIPIGCLPSPERDSNS